MNLVVQSGRITRDAETKTVGEKLLIKFTIVVRKGYKKSEDEKDYFRNVSLWSNNKENKLAGVLKKGAYVMVTGEWDSRSYKDKDGNTRYAEEINATTGRVEIAQFADREKASVSSETDVSDDDLGF